MESLSIVGKIINVNAFDDDDGRIGIVVAINHVAPKSTTVAGVDWYIFTEDHRWVDEETFARIRKNKLT